jgi:hypothetical protein
MEKEKEEKERTMHWWLTSVILLLFEASLGK